MELTALNDVRVVDGAQSPCLAVLIELLIMLLIEVFELYQRARSRVAALESAGKISLTSLRNAEYAQACFELRRAERMMLEFDLNKFESA